MELRGQWCSCCFSKYDIIIRKVSTQQIASRLYSCNSSSEMSSSQDLSSVSFQKVVGTEVVRAESISDHHPSPKSVTEGAMCFAPLPHCTDTLPVCAVQWQLQTPPAPSLWKKKNSSLWYSKSTGGFYGRALLGCLSLQLSQKRKIKNFRCHFIRK